MREPAHRQQRLTSLVGTLLAARRCPGTVPAPQVNPTAGPEWAARVDALHAYWAQHLFTRDRGEGHPRVPLPTEAGGMGISSRAANC